MNTNEIDMDKICKGCLAYERSNTFLNMKGVLKGVKYGQCPGYVFKDVDCPCQHCLIKAMCDDVCEEFKKSKWFNNYKVSGECKFNGK